MNNPIYDGVVLKCAEYGVSDKLVPVIYKLVIAKNDDLGLVHDRIVNNDK